RQPDRIGPGAGRVFRSDVVIAAVIDSGVQDVERAVVKLDGRGEHAARNSEAVEIELRGPVDDIADLAPVHEVGAFEYRYAGEVGEGGTDEVIPVARARNAG